MFYAAAYPAALQIPKVALKGLREGAKVMAGSLEEQYRMGQACQS